MSQQHLNDNISIQPQQSTTYYKKQQKSKTVATIESPSSVETSRSLKILTQTKIDEILHLIFDHFCKRSYESKPNTFDHIKHQVVVLSLNKFMIFCREFGFLAKRIITMIDLVSIFRKCSTNLKQMGFAQFKDSLRKIGEVSFKNQDDPYAKLLSFMKVDNEQDLKSQMKKIKISIPEKLIMPKHPQHFKLYPHCGKFSGDIKKQLELRRERKTTKAHSVQKKKQTICIPSATSTKYSQIHANKTRNRFQMNNVVVLARQQTQYSNRDRNRNLSIVKHNRDLQDLIEQQQDQIMEMLERRQRGYRNSYANVIQERINRLRLQSHDTKRLQTQNLKRYC